MLGTLVYLWWQNVLRGQRTTCGNHFSPTMWVAGVQNDHRDWGQASLPVAHLVEPKVLSWLIAYIHKEALHGTYGFTLLSFHELFLSLDSLSQSWVSTAPPRNSLQKLFYTTNLSVFGWWLYFSYLFHCGTGKQRILNKSSSLFLSGHTKSQLSAYTLQCCQQMHFNTKPQIKCVEINPPDQSLLFCVTSEFNYREIQNFQKTFQWFFLKKMTILKVSSVVSKKVALTLHRHQMCCCFSLHFWPSVRIPSLRKGCLCWGYSGSPFSKCKTCWLVPGIVKLVREALMCS